MGNSRIQFRRGKAAGWTSENPILFPAEPGYELDTKRYKIGDGVTPWRDLPYRDVTDLPSGDDGTALAALAAHIADETPHTVYDDGPSLTLLYENAKV